MIVDKNKELVPIYSLDNPLSIHFDDVITEGLIHTYSIDKTIEYINNLFDISNLEITKIKGDRIVVSYIDSEYSRKNMNKVMTLCGYILSKEQKQNNNIFQCYIPKYSGDVTELIHERMQYLMHISPSYYKDKILKQGFIPKSKHKDFNYNDRVYFFIQNTPSNEVFYQANEFSKKLTNEQDNRKYTVFYVKVDSLPKDVKFYIDTTYSFGVYTMDNIPPSAIYKTFDFDLDNLFESFAVKNN